MLRIAALELLLLGNGLNTARRVRFRTPSSVSCFGPYRAQGRELSEFLSALMCESELTEFFAELNEFAAELSEFSLPKQHSQNRIPPVS